MKIKLPNKKTVFFAVLLSASICGCILQAIALAKANTLYGMAKEQNESRTVFAAESPMLAGDALFRLRECGGKIGIFDAKTEILVDIIDVFVVSLPTADQNALQQGIEIFSFTDLVSIVEDLST